eukprot:7116184-Heterocapsa_arctica.AAC.1
MAKCFVPITMSHWARSFLTGWIAPAVEPWWLSSRPAALVMILETSTNLRSSCRLAWHLLYQAGLDAVLSALWHQRDLLLPPQPFASEGGPNERGGAGSSSQGC